MYGSSSTSNPSSALNWLASGGKTAFLQDANSLIMKTDQLVDILEHLRQTFPWEDRERSILLEEQHKQIVDATVKFLMLKKD